MTDVFANLFGCLNLKRKGVYLPAQLSEADVELMSPACRLLVAAVVICNRNTEIIRELQLVHKRHCVPV